jgi:hypothetical protein
MLYGYLRKKIKQKMCENPLTYRTKCGIIKMLKGSPHWEFALRNAKKFERKRKNPLTSTTKYGIINVES